MKTNSNRTVYNAGTTVVTMCVAANATGNFVHHVCVPRKKSFRDYFFRGGHGYEMVLVRCKEKKILWEDYS
jgi:hypothetical protein